MNLENITIEDAIDMAEKKGLYVQLENGQVIGFKEEKDETA